MLIILGLSFMYKNRNSASNADVVSSVDDGGIVLFFGDTCPHCKELAKTLEEKKMAEKVKFSEKEVYRNAGNAKLLMEKAKKCGFKESEVGVPFLVAEDGKCYVGNPDVIKFFDDKVNENK